jgi:hypothetical protein
VVKRGSALFAIARHGLEIVILPTVTQYDSIENEAPRHSDSRQVQGLLFSVAHNQTLMETAFLDRLATQLNTNKSAQCRRAIQRILVRMKEHCESGQYQSTTDAENEFRRLVESDLACK